MKILYWTVGLILVSSLLFVLSVVDIQSIKITYISTLWRNLNFLSTTLFALLPLLLIILLLTLVLLKKWVFHVEKVSIGGFNILFDNPNQLFRKQVNSYLNTKRTLFVVDFEHDNIKETLDSYFDVYKFLRDELKILSNTKKKRKNTTNNATNLFDLSNEMIKLLNNFLTKHQSNYRRWYTYLEKYDEKNFYLKPIGDLQKEYKNYDQLRTDFEKLNKYFTKDVAKEFNINIVKWGIQNA